MSWIKHVTVGDAGGGFGQTDCELTLFHGVVTQVTNNKMPITEISGGGGGGYMSLNNGTGQGSVSIDPVKSHTRIVCDFQLWIRSGDNQDICWQSDFPLPMAQGQEVTIVFLNGRWAAYQKRP